MKNVRGADFRVGQIDGSQLPKFRFVDENGAVLTPIGRNSLAHGLITAYIFHCEDDWEFYRPGFVEDSRAILENKPEILQV
ncbi:hypothetical protein NE645_17870, partial [Roseburia hominis]|nr:hypothetical protein [Roseburia hominis]